MHHLIIPFLAVEVAARDGPSCETPRLKEMTKYPTVKIFVCCFSIPFVLFRGCESTVGSS